MIETTLDSGSMASHEVLTQLAALFRHRKVCIFTGAGVSMPSGLPNANTLLKSMVDAIAVSFERINLGTQDQREQAINAIKQYRLERIMDGYVGVYGDRGLDFLSILERSEPNFNHRAIACLAASGYLNNIVTLNFDVLHEKALHETATKFCWNLPLAQRSKVPKNIKAHVTITKPHGTMSFPSYEYRDYFLAATLADAGDHPQQENADALTAICKKSPVLLVAGYSNDDWDISPLLTSTSWESVFWIQYDRSVPISDKILDWLKVRNCCNDHLIYGDVRILLSAILKRLSVGEHLLKDQAISSDVQVKSVNVDYLLCTPSETAFVGIGLLDGTMNHLYTSFLKAFGDSSSVDWHETLQYLWERATAWSAHVYGRTPRKAAKLFAKIAGKNLNPYEAELRKLNNYRSIFYEYVSALKRPYLNILWPMDLYLATKWKRAITEVYDIILCDKSSNPIIKKKASLNLAMSKVYVIDLYHNWGYHILPFSNKVGKGLARNIFNRIAGLYDELAKDNPNIDWEYFYVRRIEAHLIAYHSIDTSAIERLKNIRDMFRHNGRLGHYAYTLAVLGLVYSNRDYNSIREEFIEAQEIFRSSSGPATPTGILRMTLLRRYFYPKTLSLLKTLRALIRYSVAQRR